MQLRELFRLRLQGRSHGRRSYEQLSPVRANGGALPPDLSLITKAREGGADYLYSLLTGYQAVPANLPKESRPGTGLHYNPYFANLNLAMAPPLTAAAESFAASIAGPAGPGGPLPRGVAGDARRDACPRSGVGEGGGGGVGAAGARRERRVHPRPGDGCRCGRHGLVARKRLAETAGAHTRDAPLLPHRVDFRRGRLEVGPHAAVVDPAALGAHRRSDRSAG